MKTLKGLSLFFVFFLVLGSCGSGVSLYEPGTGPGAEPVPGDSEGSDIATAALLSAIFEEGEAEPIVEDVGECPEGTKAVTAEFRSVADVVDISTKVKALSVVTSNSKYADYELKVIEKLKLLLVANLQDDEVLSDLLKIIVSRLNEKEYKLLEKLVEKASEKAFDSPEKLEKKAIYACACEQKYIEKEAAGEVVKYCPSELVYNFKIAMDDQKLTQAERCKKGEEALRIIDMNASGCAEYFGLKEHFANMCLRSCDDNYNTFLKYISAVTRPGDAYCSEAAAVGTRTKDSGLCSRELLDKMAKIHAEKCTVSQACIESTKKFEELSNSEGCEALGTLQKIMKEADANRCDISKMATIIKQCSTPSEPPICADHSKAFNDVYAKSGCSAIDDLKNIIAKAEKDACTDSVAAMKKTAEQCSIPSEPAVCSDHSKAFNDVYAKSGCSAIEELGNIISKAEKDACTDTLASMKKTAEACK